MSREELIGKLMREQAMREGHRAVLPKSIEVQETTIVKMREISRKATPENLKIEALCLAALADGTLSMVDISKRIPSVPPQLLNNALRRLQTIRKVRSVRMKSSRLPQVGWELIGDDDD